MVFKKIMRALGAGGPGVETVLANPDVRPGETLTGQAHIQGGDHEVGIERLSLSLVARVEVESGDYEGNTVTEFGRVATPGFHLGPGQRHSVPFQLQIPWEAPITLMYGQPLRGMAVGVRTELAVAKAVDAGDLDGIGVHPLPSQQRVLDAFSRLGFRFHGADLERGRIYGTQQSLPFFQEIEFYPPPSHVGRINEIELSFITTAHGIDVIIEADKRGGMFTEGQDVIGRFQMSHEQALNTDWEGSINGWLGKVGQRRGW